MCTEICLLYKCIHNCSRGNSYQIILGTNRLDALGNCSLVLSSTTTIIHKKYTPGNPNNDIALIQLPTPVNFSSEYCHFMTNVKIILLVLEQIKCFLFAAQNLFVYLIHVVKYLSVLRTLSYSIAI